MSANFQRDILFELMKLFGPIAYASKGDDARQDIMAAVGWLLDKLPHTPGSIGEQLNTAFQALGDATNQLDTLLDTPPDSLEALQKVLVILLDIFNAVRALSSLSGSGVLPELGTLGEDLIQFLVLAYLERWIPSLYYAFALLTLITLPEDTPPTGEVRDASGVVVRGSYRPGELHLDRISHLLTALIQMLHDEYVPTGLSSETAAQAAADKLFPRLGGFLSGVGPDADYNSQTHILSIILPPITSTDPPSLTLALSAADDGLVVTPSGVIDITQQVGSWSIGIQLNAAGRFVVGSHGLTAGGSVDGKLSLAKHAQPGTPAVRVGSQTGTRMEVGGVSITGEFNPDPAHLNYGLLVEADSAAIIIQGGDGDGFLQRILPADGLKATFDLGLGWSNRNGFYLRGSASLEMTFGVHVSLGPIFIQDVHVGLGPHDGALRLELSTIASVDIGPVAASIDRVGLATDILFHSGNFGPLDLKFGFKPPNGLGLLIDAGAVVGGGYIFFDLDKGEYAGVLELKLETIQIKVIGLLDTKLPDGTPGFSFLFIVTVEFTPIQLGFGFSLNGVGGLAGINRTMLLDVLRAGLRNHALNSILFPEDPVRHAQQLISDLRSIFPPVDGRYVFGPMLEIAWGGFILVAKLGVILELPSPIRLAILGQITAALPTEEEALILIHMDVLGAIDFEKKSLSIDASLYDSRIVIFSLLGDMAMRLNWGANPNFALSLGGFFPGYQPPPGFPTLRRLMVSMGYGGVIQLSLSTYMAFTSNSVQFGANLELKVDLDVISIHGYFGFDVLFIFSPFSFVAHIQAGVDLEVDGLSLFSVRLNGILSGPTPWRVQGTASVDILFFSIDVHVDVTFGDATQVTLPQVEVKTPLLNALKDPRNWKGFLPAGVEPAVSLAKVQVDEHTILAQPIGLLVVQQSVVPLGVQIAKFNNAAPADADQCDITSVTVDGKNEPLENASDFFASGQFFAMSDAQKVTAPAYTSMKAGVKIGTEDLRYSRSSNLELHYDTYIVDDLAVPGRPVGSYTLPRDVMLAINRIGAAELSPVRATGNAKYVVPGTASAISVSDAKYVIASTQDLSVHTGLSGAGEMPYFAATTTLSTHLAAHPEDAGMLQVIPVHEAVTT